MASNLGGLADFLQIEISDPSGATISRQSLTLCVGADPHRLSPDAPSDNPYPRACPYHPYTLGTVQGLPAGWGTSLYARRPIKLADGGPTHLTLRASVAPKYVAMFGLDPSQSAVTSDMAVETDPNAYYRDHPAASPAPPRLEPHRSEPEVPSRGKPSGASVDLRSLPAFDMKVAGKGTRLRFGATVWNAGDAPLVIDGFREKGADEMTAYQYFYDQAGKETGHQEVGEFHYHEANHNHWHYEDFARYRLLRVDGSEVAPSGKQSFCLANTDAVDLTYPGAKWNIYNTDLSSACGKRSVITLREVLLQGSGDTYHQIRAGQAIDISGVPNGKYILSVEANPFGRLVESDVSNNVSHRVIWLKGSGDHRRVVAEQIGIIDESILR